jgi:phosphoglycolate phosphatase-like HAD superfamily hydrolase
MAAHAVSPLPGLLRQAADALDLDLSRSFFIGDSEIDMLAGHAAGCRVVAVTTGLSSHEQIAGWSVTPERVFPGVMDAVEWVDEIAQPARTA